MSDIRFLLFGPPRIQRDGAIVDLGRRKALAMAVYLAATGTSHSRETLAALLWPENPPASAKAEVRRALSLLSTALGAGVVETDRSTVRIAASAWVDTARLRAVLGECETHGHPSDQACPRCLPLLTEAARLGASEFLAGFSLGECEEFETWRRGEAEAFQAERGSALSRLSLLHERAGDRKLALDAARKWLAVDPLCEPAHRRVMSLAAASGQRSVAMRQYEACVRVLRDAGGVQPEAETTRLWERIRDRRLQEQGPAPASSPAPAPMPAGPAADVTERFRVFLHRRRLPLALAAAALLAALAGGAVVLVLSRASAAPTAIAVLPLADTSGPSGEEWFADGMTEALLTELARIRGFRVTSHESVRAYAGSTKTVPVIRKELGVSFLLEGSVMRAEDKVRIAVQLIDARRDAHLWAETYERDWADVLGLQKEIACDVADRVRVRLTGQEKKLLGTAGRVDVRAYESALIGQYLMSSPFPDPQRMKRSFEAFHAAVAHDPRCAPAWIGLANCYWGATQFGLYAPEQGMPLAKDAAEKALALDPSSAAAHTVLALIHFLFDWDWKAAEEEFRTAIDLEPSSAEAHRWYGSLLSSLARHREAITEVVQAWDIDPLSVLNGVNVSARYYYARQYDKAIAAAMTVAEMEKGFYMAPMMAGEAFAAKGDYPRAIAELTRAAELAGDWGMEPLAFLGWIFGSQGRADDARDILRRLDQMEARGASVAPFLRAEPLLGLGQTEKALDLLEKAYEERDLNLVWNFPDPLLDRLRGEPRFIALKKKLGL